MEDNKKNVLNNQPNNEEDKKKNKLLAWWLGLGKWAKVGVCAGAATVLTSAVVFPTLAATVWNKGNNPKPEPQPVIDGYKIDWNTKKHYLQDFGESFTLHEIATLGVTNVVKIYQSDSTDGTLCGETDGDLIYFSTPEDQLNGGGILLNVWSKKTIIFEDNDRGENNKGFFEQSNPEVGFAARTVVLDNINTSLVTDMSNLFKGVCGYYAESDFTLDLSNFDTSNVTKMSGMFDLSAYTGVPSGKNLTKIKVNPDKFKVDKVLGDNGDKGVDMFKGQDKIVGAAGTAYNENNVGASYAHVDEGTSNPGYFGECYFSTDKKTYEGLLGNDVTIKLLTNPDNLDLSEATFNVVDDSQGKLSYTYNKTTKEIVVSNTPPFEIPTFNLSINITLKTGRLLQAKCSITFEE